MKNDLMFSTKPKDFSWSWCSAEQQIFKHLGAIERVWTSRTVVQAKVGQDETH